MIGWPPRASNWRQWRHSSHDHSGALASSTHSAGVQPRSGPSSSGTTHASAASRLHAVPRRSSVVPGCGGSCGSSRSAPAMASSPTGRLIRNTVRQPSPATLASINKPPTTGPSADDTPPSRPKMVKARMRSCGAYSACISVSTCGTMMAAQAPWTMRASTRPSADVARPQPSDATVKLATPHRNMRRWPNRSPMRPPTTSSTAKRQRITRHQPGHLGRTGLQRLADGWQRHIDDGHVQQVHHEGDGHHGKGQCAPAPGQWRLAWRCSACRCR